MLRPLQNLSQRLNDNTIHINRFTGVTDEKKERQGESTQKKQGILQLQNRCKVFNAIKQLTASLTLAESFLKAKQKSEIFPNYLILQMVSCGVLDYSTICVTTSIYWRQLWASRGLVVSKNVSLVGLNLNYIVGKASKWKHHTNLVV